MIAPVGHHAGPIGGGAASGSTAADPGLRPVTELTGELPQGAPVRHFELTARQQTITSAAGKTVEAWTFGSLPGPALEAELGDIIEVVLANRDVAAGVTLHWHGYDVPNAMDGVAGGTQDTLRPGQAITYRFEARQTGTYWYHTHQMSAEGVRKGLYGTLVVRDPGVPRAATDLVVAGHSLASLTLLGSSDGVQVHEARTGTDARLRLVNTDSLPQRYQLLGTHYSVAAVDGAELAAGVGVPAAEASGTILRLPAGGRMDLTFTVPDHPVTLRTEGSSSAAVVLVPAADGATPPAAHGAAPTPATADFRAGTELDLLAASGQASGRQGCRLPEPAGTVRQSWSWTGSSGLWTASHATPTPSTGPHFRK
ncbi:multicopper oxidase domain-containing protein [Pseudarthrobacter sp. NamB4]|uniref:multicopper oxidase domain-containing protein n=1 Tax=Pseudarthrobacter sp. NamB4 TaxID=2576837 RepID=UPI001485344D|nr:multicopper oxidase domain-containing protein [Pseudarthrobacter sp. NamB4]